jgi:excisionase family DNA binding protein
MTTTTYIQPKQWLTKKEASAELGICTRTLESIIRRGDLKVSKPTHQLLRISRSALDAFMAKFESVRE